MAGTTRGNVYAFERAFVWRVGSNGIATGQLDPDNLGSAPLTSHAYELRGPITATPPEPSFAAAEFRGGGKFEGRADMGLESIGAGTIVASQMDVALDAFLQGGLVDTTSLVNATISSPNSLNPGSRTVGLMLVGRIQSRASATAGANQYLTIIYPRVQMRSVTPNMTQEGGANPAPVTLTFQPSVATRFPTGIAFGANQGWTDNSEFHFRLTSDYPYALTSFVQDATETTYTVAYRPVSSTVTGGNTTNWFTVGGVATAPSSFNTSTGVVTLAAAGSANVVDVAFYQTNYVPVS